MGTPSAELVDEGVAQVSRRPAGAEAGRFGDLAELTADVRRVQRRPDDRGEDEVVILPQGTGRQPVLGLPLAMLPQGMDGRLGQRQGSP